MFLRDGGYIYLVSVLFYAPNPVCLEIMKFLYNGINLTAHNCLAIAKTCTSEPVLWIRNDFSRIQIWIRIFCRTVHEMLE